jgi:hypothetical protein
MYKFELVKVDDISLIKYVKLLQEVFPKSKKFTFDFVKWQYASNPIGNIVGFNAFYGDELAGHYVTMPVYANINGVKKLGLLSLNTVTHASHRGKGLFTKLAEMTYKYAIDNEYEFVYGVANANSTPGFVRKLGFQFVAPLTVKVGLGKLPQKDEKDNFDFERIWAKEDVNWRLNNPEQPYFIEKKQIMVTTEKITLNAIMGVFEDDLLKDFKSVNKYRKFGLAKLYVGINSSINWRNSLYFGVPNRFKSSPLNLIFKDLTGNNYQLDKERIKFQIIDFDGY